MVLTYVNMKLNKQEEIQKWKNDLKNLSLDELKEEHINVLSSLIRQYPKKYAIKLKTNRKALAIKELIEEK